MEFFAKSKSTNISVYISDSKKGDKTIILLHGYLETIYIWEDFREYLKDYRTIAIDLPGHGLTTSHPESNSMELCADVVKDVMEICNVSKAVVAGHSMGGYVAQMCCKKYPELFTGLILLNSNTFADSEEKKKDRVKDIIKIEGNALLNIASAMIPKMYYSDNLRRCDDIIRETIEICETHDPMGIIASINGLMARSDYNDFIKGYKSPALFIYGENDPFLSEEKRLEMINNYPNVEHKTLPKCAHNSFIEYPELVKKEVVQFMDKFSTNE